MHLPAFVVGLLARAHLSTPTYLDPSLAPIWKPHAGEHLPNPGNYTFIWHVNGNYTGNMTLSLWEGENIHHLKLVSGIVSDVPINSGSYRFNVAAPDVSPITTFRLKTVPDNNITIYNYSPPFHIGNRTDEI